MADFGFNISRGSVAYLWGLPATNDAVLFVLLKQAGIDSDATMKDLDTLAAILGGSDECDFTNYARKTASGLTVVTDDTNDWRTVDADDLNWVAAGGGTNNTTGKLIACYDPDTTGGTDSSIIPLLAWDKIATTVGDDLPVVFAPSGVARFRAA